MANLIFRNFALAVVFATVLAGCSKYDESVPARLVPARLERIGAIPEKIYLIRNDAWLRRAKRETENNFRHLSRGEDITGASEQIVGVMDAVTTTTSGSTISCGFAVFIMHKSRQVSGLKALKGSL